jgi:hypothetical protein
VSGLAAAVSDSLIDIPLGGIVSSVVSGVKPKNAKTKCPEEDA